MYIERRRRRPVVTLAQWRKQRWRFSGGFLGQDSEWKRSPEMDHDPPFGRRFVGRGMNRIAVQMGMPAVVSVAPRDNEYWVAVTDQSIPEDAFVAGEDENGEPIYIARGCFAEALTPGRLDSSGFTIAWGGAQRQLYSYQVLCGFLGSWVRTERDDIPDDALVGGVSEEGEMLFVGRAYHEGVWVPGKVQKTHRTCYIGVDGQEIAYDEFEVLVIEEQEVDR